MFKTGSVTTGFCLWVWKCDCVFGSAVGVLWVLCSHTCFWSGRLKGGGEKAVCSEVMFLRGRFARWVYKKGRHHNVSVTGTTNELAQPPSRISVMFWLVVVPEKEFHQYLCGSRLRSAAVQRMKNTGQPVSKAQRKFGAYRTRSVVQLWQNLPHSQNTGNALRPTKNGGASPEVVLRLLIAAVGGVKVSKVRT